MPMLSTLVEKLLFRERKAIRCMNILQLHLQQHKDGVTTSNIKQSCIEWIGMHPHGRAVVFYMLQRQPTAHKLATLETPAGLKPSSRPQMVLPSLLRYLFQGNMAGGWSKAYFQSCLFCAGAHFFCWFWAVVESKMF